MSFFPRIRFVKLVVVAVVSAVCFIAAGSLTAQGNTPLSRDLVDRLPAKEKRFALIIGVDKYTSNEINSLRGSANDAIALKNALKEFAGFPEDQIVVLASSEPEDRQPTRTNILRRIANLKAKIPTDGLLLVSFSGHGIERGGRAFLLPSDAVLENDINLLEETAIGATFLLDRIRGTGVKQVMILLDACRNDPEAGRGYSGNALTEAYKRGFTFDAKNKDIEAFATLYATSVGSRAYENGEKKQGYFSLAVVDGLGGKAANPATGEVTLGSLVKYVEATVPAQVALNSGPGREQKPFHVVGGYRADELVLAITERPASPIAEPAKPKATLLGEGEKAFWALIERKGTCIGYEEYLKAYPEGEFVLAARMGLKLCDRSADAKPANEKKPTAEPATQNVPIKTPILVPTSPSAVPERKPDVPNTPVIVQEKPKVETGTPPVPRKTPNVTGEFPLDADPSPDTVPVKTAEKPEQPAKPSIGTPVVVVGELPKPTIVGPGQIKAAEKTKSPSQLAKEKWILVRRTNDPNELRTFLTEFPTSAFAAAAKSSLQKIVWAEANKTNSIAKYEFYIKEFPNGPNAKLARSRIARLIKAGQSVQVTPTEKEVWEKIQSGNNVSELEAFVKQFPAGEFYATANAKLEKLRENARLGFLRSRWELMLEDGRFGKVLNEATDVVSSEPSNVIALTARLLANDQLGRLNEGERDALAVNNSISEPRSIFESESLAIAKIRLGEFDKAIGICNQALVAERDNPRLLYLRGKAFLKKQELQLAANDLEKVVQSDPTRLSGHIEFVEALIGLKRNDQARVVLNRMVAILPNKSASLVRRAAFLMEQNELSSALEDLKIVIENNPNYIYAYSVRASLYERQGQLDLAEADLSKAIQLGPDRSYTFMDRAGFYVRQKQTEKAIGDLNSTISLDPDNRGAFLARGKVYFETANFKEAQADFDRLLEVDPRSSEGLLYLARLEANTIRKIDILEKAINADPAFAQALIERGELLASRKQFDQAVKDFDKAIELDKTAGQTYISRAISLYQLKAYERSVADVTKALELLPERRELFKFRAMAYEQLGQKEKAKADEISAKPIKKVQFVGYSDVRSQ